jgi:hypothetical protein
MRLPILGNQELESGVLSDERSGLSMVEILGQIWTIRFMEVTCREINRIGETRDREFGSPVIERLS